MKLTLKPEPKGKISGLDVGGVPRVNLLPQVVVAKREQNVRLKRWSVRIGGAAVVLAVAAVGMFAWQGMLSLQLKGTQDEGLSLLAQISEKSEIQQLMNMDSALQDLESEALATRLGWEKSIGLLLQNFPEGSYLCGFELQAGGIPSDEPVEDIGLAGVVEICGTFRSAIPFLRDATSVDGVKSALVLEGEVSNREGIYVHNIKVELDQTIYESVVAESEPAEGDNAVTDDTKTGEAAE